MLEEYREESLQYAKKIGLWSSATEEQRIYEQDFIAREGWARRVIAAVVKQINSSLTITNMPLLNGYDAEVLSGNTLIKIEAKCRGYDKVFKTAKISPGENKSDFIQNKSGWILEYYDKLRKWWIWDLNQYTPDYEEDSWDHNKWTSHKKNNYRFKEDAWVFDRTQAIMSGKLPMKNG